MNYKTILSLMAIAIVIVVAYPYAISAYHSFQSQPEFEFGKVDVDKIQDEKKCTLNISGNLKINYEGKLKEVVVKASAKGKMQTYPNKPPKKNEYSVPSTIMEPETDNPFQFYVEIPEKCKYVDEINVSVKGYKKKYF